MATPTADSYSVASGATVYAGMTAGFYDLTIAEIAALPAESWFKLNYGENRLDSIFPPLDLRAEYGTGGPPCAWDRILGAWGGFGWDSVNHRLVQIGGGHANSSCNGSIEWRLEDRSWHLGFHDSEMVPVAASSLYRSVDFQSTPVSAHTYGNNNYLPILGRFFSFGGASYNAGNTWMVYDTAIPGYQTQLRRVGAYTLDMAQARQGKVAGATGSNNKRGAYVGVSLDGANAWNLRDWWAKDASARPTFNGGYNYDQHVNGGTAYLTRNGHDALLYTSTPGTAKSVLLVEFVDDNGDNDLHYFVGGYDGDDEGQGQVAYSDSFEVFLKNRNGGSATTCFRFVDLKRTWGQTNDWRTPTLTGTDLAEFLALDMTDSGMHWNPIKGCFTIHFYSPQVWEVYPPAGNPTPDTGWTVVKPTMAAAGATGLPRDYRIFVGADVSEAGVIGKVKWAPDLNCAVKIEDNLIGSVWLYKPTGWVDPR